MLINLYVWRKCDVGCECALHNIPQPEDKIHASSSSSPIPTDGLCLPNNIHEMLCKSYEALQATSVQPGIKLNPNLTTSTPEVVSSHDGKFPRTCDVNRMRTATSFTDTLKSVSSLPLSLVRTNSSELQNNEYPAGNKLSCNTTGKYTVTKSVADEAGYCLFKPETSCHYSVHNSQATSTLAENLLKPSDNAKDYVPFSTNSTINLKNEFGETSFSSASLIETRDSRKSALTAVIKPFNANNVIRSTNTSETFFITVPSNLKKMKRRVKDPDETANKSALTYRMPPGIQAVCYHGQSEFYRC